MKSYSDNIPNVSTDEIKRSAKVADNTNEIVNNTNERLVELSSQTERQFYTIRKYVAFNTFLLVLTLGVSSAALILKLLPFFNG